MWVTIRMAWVGMLPLVHSSSNSPLKAIFDLPRYHPVNVVVPGVIEDLGYEVAS